MYLTEKIFFITCNLLPTRIRFSEGDFAQLASAFQRARERRRFLLAGYVFMPDHWHALLVPGPNDDLPRMMDALKVSAARGINRWRRQTGELWQPRFFDYAIRTVKDFHEKLDYIHMNPVRKGLVKRAEDWLWSSIHSYGGPGPVRLAVDFLNLPADERTRL